MSSTLEPAVEPSPAPSGATFHPMHSQGDSIVDFVKYMIGCNEGNHPLPPQPTIIEMHICEEFNATHGVQYQLPAYLPSDLLVHSKFTPAAKNRCDLDFHVKGFSRITFEWKKPSLTDSSWNRTTVDILCDHYGMWVLNEQSTTNDFSPVNGNQQLKSGWSAGKPNSHKNEQKWPKVKILWIPISRRMIVGTRCIVKK
ncbi:hypothetical protein H4Q26_004038 [Puccinia striiformis f. sp. tritici PST-130]|nr:hypothetical protein H4Q26_004038 [Puccinia striiformis f. sp. tritici PST-130]